MISIASGKLNYESETLEFIGPDQDNVVASVTRDGVVSWVYYDEDSACTNEIAFKFKLKDSKQTSITLKDYQIVTEATTLS